MARKSSASNRVLSITHAWNQLPDESEKAYEAFSAYLDSPYPRTVAAAAYVVGKSESVLMKWAAKWRWHERAASKDNHEANVAQEARDVIIARTAAEWQKRKQDECESVYVMGLTLRNRALAMLKFPLAKETTVDDGKTIHIHPARWTLATACTLAKLSADLVGLAIGEAMNDDDGFDPLVASADECREYIQRQVDRKKQMRSIAGTET